MLVFDIFNKVKCVVGTIKTRDKFLDWVFENILPKHGINPIELTYKEAKYDELSTAGLSEGYYLVYDDGIYYLIHIFGIVNKGYIYNSTEQKIELIGKWDITLSIQHLYLMEQIMYKRFGKDVVRVDGYAAANRRVHVHYKDGSSKVIDLPNDWE